MAISATFPVNTIAGLNPERVDMERDSNTSTAQTWTLHLRIPDGDIASVRQCAVQIETASKGLIFDYTGGDSFAEWAESYGVCDPDDPEQPGRALHLYFEATDLAHATMVARILCALSNDVQAHLRAVNVTLSAAGDWAEQTEVWSN